jgi:hypothetical protein
MRHSSRHWIYLINCNFFLYCSKSVELGCLLGCDQKIYSWIAGWVVHAFACIFKISNDVAKNISSQKAWPKPCQSLVQLVSTTKNFHSLTNRFFHNSKIQNQSTRPKPPHKWNIKLEIHRKTSDSTWWSTKTRPHSYKLIMETIRYVMICLWTHCTHLQRTSHYNSIKWSKQSLSCPTLFGKTTMIFRWSETASTCIGGWRPTHSMH